MDFNPFNTVKLEVLQEGFLEERLRAIFEGENSPTKQALLKYLENPTEYRSPTDRVFKSDAVLKNIMEEIGICFPQGTKDKIINAFSKLQNDVERETFAQELYKNMSIVAKKLQQGRTLAAASSPATNSTTTLAKSAQTPSQQQPQPTTQKQQNTTVVLSEQAELELIRTLEAELKGLQQESSKAPDIVVLQQQLNKMRIESQSQIAETQKEITKLKLSKQETQAQAIKKKESAIRALQIQMLEEEIAVYKKTPQQTSSTTSKTPAKTLTTGQTSLAAQPGSTSISSQQPQKNLTNEQQQPVEPRPPTDPYPHSPNTTTPTGNVSSDPLSNYAPPAPPSDQPWQPNTILPSQSGYGGGPVLQEENIFLPDNVLRIQNLFNGLQHTQEKNNKAIRSNINDSSLRAWQEKLTSPIDGDHQITELKQCQYYLTRCFLENTPIRSAIEALDLDKSDDRETFEQLMYDMDIAISNTTALKDIQPVLPPRQMIDILSNQNIYGGGPVLTNAAASNQQIPHPYQKEYDNAYKKFKTAVGKIDDDYQELLKLDEYMGDPIPSEKHQKEMAESCQPQYNKIYQEYMNETQAIQNRDVNFPPPFNYIRPSPTYTPEKQKANAQKPILKTTGAQKTGQTQKTGHRTQFASDPTGNAPAPTLTIPQPNAQTRLTVKPQTTPTMLTKQLEGAQNTLDQQHQQNVNQPGGEPLRFKSAANAQQADLMEIDEQNTKNRSLDDIQENIEAVIAARADKGTWAVSPSKIGKPSLQLEQNGKACVNIQSKGDVINYKFTSHPANPAALEIVVKSAQEALILSSRSIEDIGAILNAAKANNNKPPISIDEKTRAFIEKEIAKPQSAVPDIIKNKLTEPPPEPEPTKPTPKT